MKGSSMRRIKKAFLFLLGMSILPNFFGALMAKILEFDDFKCFAGFFLLVYLVIYFSFPHLYSEKMQKHFPNRYMLYALLYAGIFVGALFILFILGVTLSLFEK